MSGTKKPKTGEAWEQPPTVDRPDWAAVAKELRSRPMTWLRVYSNRPATWADMLRRSEVRALRPDLGFEFSTSENTRDTPRTCTLYARWNPNKVDPLSAVVAGEEI